MTEKKSSATELLKIFGLKPTKIFRNLFDIDTDEEIKYIQTTLKKDPTKNASEAFIEIYKRIRPGDLATAENAKSLIEAMFFRFDRYDLTQVGRFKINQRLNLSSASKVLELDDIIKIIRNIIKLNNEQTAEPDDIDHLGNRRVRPVGELLEGKLRIGLARLKRVVQDRMSTLEVETLAPVQLVNARPLVSVVKEFFSSSQLSQYMEQVNPLTEVEHKRRISAMGPGGLTKERAGFEVRDVHRSHYGRICPIETPEGSNIGLVNHLANFSRINSLGFLETPTRL